MVGKPLGWGPLHNQPHIHLTVVGIYWVYLFCWGLLLGVLSAKVPSQGYPENFPVIFGVMLHNLEREVSSGNDFADCNHCGCLLAKAIDLKSWHPNWQPTVTLDNTRWRIPCVIPGPLMVKGWDMTKKINKSPSSHFGDIMWLWPLSILWHTIPGRKKFHQRKISHQSWLPSVSSKPWSRQAGSSNLCWASSESFDSRLVILDDSWSAKCPILLGNFTLKSSNYCLKIGHLAFQVVTNFNSFFHH